MKLSDLDRLSTLQQVAADADAEIDILTKQPFFSVRTAGGDNVLLDSDTEAAVRAIIISSAKSRKIAALADIEVMGVDIEEEAKWRDNAVSEVAASAEAIDAIAAVEAPKGKKP